MLPLPLSWRRSIRGFLTAGCLALGSSAAWAVDFTVTNTNDSGAGSLRQAILDSNAAGGFNTINVTTTGTITVATVLPNIQSNVTIVGSGSDKLTVSGNNATRVFFADKGVIAISNMTIANGNAKGGAGGDGFGGGGGGLGAGGGVYVNKDAQVSLQNVVFKDLQATGGAGGASTNVFGSGGGGGLGGNGANGTISSGGGGGQITAGGVGDVPGKGGGGGAIATPGANGSAGGGGGTDLQGNVIGGQGGVGAGSAGKDGGGGGGGGIASAGGAGGDHGGGGGGSNNGGAGGFGGGGGGGAFTGGKGSGGGDGGIGGSGGGGGWALGGAIFVREGGLLTIVDSSLPSVGTVTAGKQGAGLNVGVTDGKTDGKGIYLFGSSSLNYIVSGGRTQSVDDVIGGTGSVLIGSQRRTRALSSSTARIPTPAKLSSEEEP